ncbi:iron dicitrate transport regulator FecR [Bradyrhizobium sp. Leo121]|nr:iron dicitrate transport regulator FecR [Bradyrhizobium sp. Leo121]
MTTQNEPKPMIPAIVDENPADLDPIRREAYEWIARFMAGDMMSADVDAMKMWYRQSPEHKNAYAEARRVWQSLGPIANESRHDSGAAAIIQMARKPAVPSRRMVIGGLMAAAAASAAYVAVRPPLDLWPSYTELMADVRTGAGERRQVVLVENVSLDLNTRTSIALRQQSSAATQIELLTGEAAISTGVSAPPFTVIAAGGRVTAADAEFNLRCDGVQASISCLRGRLSVERNGQSMSLGGGQQVSYGGGGMGAVDAVDRDSVTAWQRGVLTFDAVPVDRVIAEVNRYRPGRIILMNGEIGRRLLNARLKVDETDKIIVQIVHIFGAKARQLPGGIVLLT